MRFRDLVLCFSFVFWILPLGLEATHIVGGEITYRCLGAVGGGLNRYELTMNVYRDCDPSSLGFDQTVNVAVFDGLSFQRLDTLTIDIGTTDTLLVVSHDTCFAPIANICYAHTVYVKEILLPDNPNGYVFSWQRCCRNGTILNILNPLTTGMTYTTQVPATSYCNSSPVFNNQPPTYICLNDTFIFDHSANESDGDSLIYQLTDPYVGASGQGPLPNPAAPPYNPVQWAMPYSANNILGGTPPMQIDAQTGELTAIPNTPGQFVFSVSVFEYRNGVLISEVKRDFQLNIMDCPQNEPPVIIPPVGPNVHGDTLIFTSGQYSCFPIAVFDLNQGAGVDSVTIHGEGSMFGDSANFPGPYASLADSGLSPLTAQICWTPICAQASSIHTILIPAKDNWDCPEPHVVFDTLFARVIPDIPEPPEVRCVSVNSDSSITVTWLNPPSTRLEGFLHYELFRWDNISSWIQLTTIGDSLQNNFTDTSVIDCNSISYCYRMATAKDCPNYLLGQAGGEACSMVLKTDSISQVETDVLWNPYQVWPQPAYEIFVDSGGTWLPFDFRIDTLFRLTRCDFEGTFRLRTTDPVTACEAWSGYSPTVIHHDLPPAPLEWCRVSVVPGDKAIRLDWTAFSDGDLTNLIIYRKRSDENIWTAIYSGQDFSWTNFVDEGLNCDQFSYCYQLELTDICGNIIESTISCSMVLSGESKPYRSFLSWSRYIGWEEELIGYEVKLKLGTNESSIAMTDTLTLDYFDEAITEDLPQYCYRIEAINDGSACDSGSFSNEVCLLFPPTLFFPNSFTPNGDGLNDEFSYPNLFLAEFNIQIYDRWGMLLFESADQKSYWDGTFRGQAVPEGVFVYIARGKGYSGEPLQFRGTVMILR